MLHTATVHALTMEMGLARIRHLSLSRRNPSAHISTSIDSLQSSSPTCDQTRFVGRNVGLLDPGVQLQIFHLLDFSFISSLDFVGGQSIDQGAFTACSNNQVCVRPSFLFDSCLLRHVFIVDWFQLMRCRWSSLEVILIRTRTRVQRSCVQISTNSTFRLLR